MKTANKEFPMNQLKAAPFTQKNEPRRQAFSVETTIRPIGWISEAFAVETVLKLKSSLALELAQMVLDARLDNKAIEALAHQVNNQCRQVYLNCVSETVIKINCDLAVDIANLILEDRRENRAIVALAYQILGNE
jgi:hypothetical protein